MVNGTNAEYWDDGFESNLSELARRIGLLFYLVNPKESSFDRLEDVPNYTDQVC
jgi:hypothetical protein